MPIMKEKNPVQKVVSFIMDEVREISEFKLNYFLTLYKIEKEISAKGAKCTKEQIEEICESERNTVYASIDQRIPDKNVMKRREEMTSGERGSLHAIKLVLEKLEL